ncbi:DUF3226 domain-containing protein [Sorangium sp. So ce128]|uniref:DUF3226 domain-containing protein n=1 Tax=Sorangium sp. So ce128 TaxID=3133281 RepID=UPI003F5EB48D
MSRVAKRVLLVEGQEDLRVVPWLIEGAGVPWGPKNAPIVSIFQYDGVENLLAAGEIEAQMKASGLVALGVMIDADMNAADRWTRIRARIADAYPSAPETLPAEGVVLKDDKDAAAPAFGAWIMPDNVNRGMLETFLLYLRPTDNQPLLDLSAKVVDEACTQGAPFSKDHRDKAQIHSWLAWQNPPGRQLHNAIMERMLSGSSPCLSMFVRWFCRLYDVAPPAPPAPSAPPETTPC